MALFHMTVKVIGRKDGRSVTAAAAYRSASVIRDERTGELHDYRAKGNVAHTEILTPENAPAWMAEREKLWNGIEAVEKRKDAQLAREIELALPRELTRDQQVELVREFVREEFVSRGMVADIAIHAPKAGDRRENAHAHILLTMRGIEGDGFGKKAREWNDDERYVQSRARWAEKANERLRRHGHDQAATLDHRSYAERGIEREGTVHMGPYVAGLERRGVRTEVGDLNRAVLERNAGRDLARKAVEDAREALQWFQKMADDLAASFRRTMGHLAELRAEESAERPAAPVPQRTEPTPPPQDPEAEWRRLVDARSATLRQQAEKRLAEAERAWFTADHRHEDLSKQAPVEPRGFSALVPGARARHQQAWAAWKDWCAAADKERCHHHKAVSDLRVFLGTATFANPTVEKLAQRVDRELRAEHPKLAREVDELRDHRAAEARKEAERRAQERRQHRQLDRNRGPDRGR